ncbi:hypothetical protein CFK37_03765 [Virgibacillus phasianinus]|uniref:Uncharacterized protein n=1 Tax=Virgibacillus phasianinus TaxID=2017483 RepID=A0A220U0H2_9BACI|nr:hypothetical protein [Virgibacillus phasianinus]ASK61351.1 hypothetical protein CFK37_03765 [Virgibacillus phasianinus]
MKSAYKIVSTFDSACPATLVLTDEETGNEDERRIWNPDPDGKDDLYVCLYNPYQHHVQESDAIEDLLDVYHMEEVLMPGMYQHLQTPCLMGKNR